MWKILKPVIVQFLSSKKALATLAAIIVWSLAQAGIVFSVDAIIPILGLVATYVLGQGFADIGKEKIRIEADNRKTELEAKAARVNK